MLLLPWHKLPIHVLFFTLTLLTAGCGDDPSSAPDESVVLFDDQQPESMSADTTPSTPPADGTAADSIDAVDAPAAPRTEADDTEATTDATDPVPTEPETPAEVSTELNFMALAEAGDVVEFVQVNRYMGRWYEIATTPSFQQLSCFGTQAEYAFDEDNGWVDVTNRCYVGNADGRVQEIQGRAELVDTETQAKLDVIFFNQRSPYWVVALDGSDSEEPYQWAVVSGPGNYSLWILSRTPTITDEARSEINAHLEARGFDIGALIDTRHSETE